MSENQIVTFKMKTKEGAEIDFHADGLNISQMNNILNNIIKPNIAPAKPFVLSAMGKKRTIANDIVQKPNLVVDYNLGKIEEVPPTIPVETDEEKAEREKAELLNDIAINTKDVSIIDSKINNTFGMAELLGDTKLQKLYDTNPPAKVENTDGNPDYYHTGIKYSGDDKPRYRTFYDCPRCSNQGRHYIPKNVKYIRCHNCQTQLDVVPATDKGFGHGDKYRDDYGNFFVAKTIHVNDNPQYETGS